MNNEVEKILQYFDTAPVVEVKQKKPERNPWPVSVTIIPLDATIKWHPDRVYVDMMAPELLTAYKNLEGILNPQRQNAVRLTKRYRDGMVFDTIHRMASSESAD